MGARVIELRPGAAGVPASERSEALPHSAAADLEAAELFLLSLERETLTGDGLRAAYLLGLAEGHLANVVEALRAVAR